MLARGWAQVPFAAPETEWLISMLVAAPFTTFDDEARFMLARHFDLQEQHLSW